MRWSTLALIFSLVAGCTGTIGDPGPDDIGNLPPIDPADPLAHPEAFGATGISRLTRAEYRQTVIDLLEVDVGPDIELLPLDDVTPFDNDYTTQAVSRTLIEAVKALADRTAERAMADADFRERLLGCTPSSATDEACLRTFIERFGRRAIRRPLTGEEVDEYAAFISFAETADDFYVAVSMVLRALLQDMEFLYRIEIGEEIAPNVYALTDFEVAQKLSYLLWGSTPDDALLDRAAEGDLRDETAIREEAMRLLADPRGVARTQRFHAMWLGYESIDLSPDLAQALRAESDALIERVVFTDGAPWQELFTTNETFVDDMLADHYGLPRPGTPSWVSYDGTQGRAGLLSHGAFLSGGAKFGDTSPTQRGLLIRMRLLCQEVPEPDPSLGVDVDTPPMSATSFPWASAHAFARQKDSNHGCQRRESHANSH